MKTKWIALLFRNPDWLDVPLGVLSQKAAWIVVKDFHRFLQAMSPLAEVDDALLARKVRSVSVPLQRVQNVLEEAKAASLTAPANFKRQRAVEKTNHDRA